MKQPMLDRQKMIQEKAYFYSQASPINDPVKNWLDAEKEIDVYLKYLSARIVIKVDINKPPKLKNYVCPDKNYTCPVCLEKVDDKKDVYILRREGGTWKFVWVHKACFNKNCKSDVLRIEDENKIDRNSWFSRLCFWRNSKQQITKGG